MLGKSKGAPRDFLDRRGFSVCLRLTGAIVRTVFRGVAMARKSMMVSSSGVGKRLLNVREAAQYLGLEVDTVYKKARLREVPSVKVGRALRFDVKALERFIEQHTIETIDN